MVCERVCCGVFSCFCGAFFAPPIGKFVRFLVLCYELYDTQREPSFNFDSLVIFLINKIFGSKRVVVLLLGRGLTQIVIVNSNNNSGNSSHNNDTENKLKNNTKTIMITQIYVNNSVCEQYMDTYRIIYIHTYTHYIYTYIYIHTRICMYIYIYTDVYTYTEAPRFLSIFSQPLGLFAGHWRGVAATSGPMGA